MHRRPLSDALVAFHASTRIDLIWNADLVADKWTTYHPERDETPEQMLRGLIRGTDLDFYRLPSGTYVLVKAPSELPSGSVGGVVRDGMTGAPLPGAHVLLADATAGTVTNDTGLFHFGDVRPGRYRLLVTYMGYSAAIDTVQVTAGARTSVQFTLAQAFMPILPLIVEDQRLSSRPHGFAHLWTDEQLSRAQMLGMPDAIRSLNQLMGVRVGDAMADVHVQGGETGEHQFRLDGVPVFEPVHLRGLLGAFNPFALQRITVHKAGFGATHGSYLAGVIAAEHALVSPEGHAVDLQVDPLSLNARVHLSTGSPAGLKLQAMAAARTSLMELYPARLSPYRDLLRDWNTPDPFLSNASLIALQQALPEISDQIEAMLDTLYISPVTSPALGFSDLHAAARLQFNLRQNLYASFYRGWNRLNGNQLSLIVEPDEALQRFQGTATGPAAIRDSVAANRDDYQWANLNGQVHYTSLLGDRTLAGVRLRGSRYSLGHAYSTLATDAAQVIGIPDPVTGRLIPIRLIEGVQPTDDGNGISEVALEATLDHDAPRHYLQFGVETVRTVHRFTIEDVYYRPVSHKAAVVRLAAFAQDQTTLTERLTLTLGARLTLLPQRQTAYAEPRGELLYDVPSSPVGPWSFRAAAGLYRQFVNQFNVSSVSPSALLPAIRFWLPVDYTVAPPKAYHVAGSVLVRPAHRWRLQAEAYFKKQPHLLSIDYRKLWTRIDSGLDTAATLQSDFLSSLRGFAYGSALSAEHTTPHTRVLARYDFSRAERERTLVQPAPPATAPPGLPALAAFALAEPAADSLGRYEPVPWNEPHRLELAFDWLPTRRLTGTVRWRGIWGRTWAFRQAYYDYLATNPEMPALFGERPAMFGRWNLLEPDQHRLKPFSQMDVGIAYTQDIGPTALQIRLDVLNVLDQTNEADWRLQLPSDGRQTFEKVARTLLPRTFSAALRLRW